MNDHDLLLAIQEELDGVEWTPDTLQTVAALLTSNGYTVRDLGEALRESMGLCEHGKLDTCAVCALAQAGAS